MKTKVLFLIVFSMSLLVSGQIIHIPANYPTIQEGINAAANGDTVLVADSTYYENINFLGKAIIVASQFIIDGDENHINNTTIDGSQANNPDSAATVFFINGEDTTSILCGLTITGGSGVKNTIWQSRYGGGIYCWNAGAKIIHNRIIDNTVTDPSTNCGGGGIGCGMTTGNYWIVIDNNIISNNLSIANAAYASGGGIHVSCNAIITNNTIEDNNCINTGTTAEGGGIEVEQIPGFTISE